MPLIVKTHLDLRNDKCINMYFRINGIWEFNKFIEIKWINLFGCSILFHLLTNSFPQSNKTYVNMKTQFKAAFIVTPSQFSPGLTFVVNGI